MFKKTNKKGALELSMNTIIIIVIGVTLLILGLTFVKGIFGKTTKLADGAFEKAEGQIGVDANLEEALSIMPKKISLDAGEDKITTIVVANLGKTEIKFPTINTIVVTGGTYNKDLECTFVETGTSQVTRADTSLKSGEFAKIDVNVKSTGAIGTGSCKFTAKIGAETKTGTLAISVEA